MDAGEIESYCKVINNNKKRGITRAMQDELDTLKKNHTYDMEKHCQCRKV